MLFFHMLNKSNSYHRIREQELWRPLFSNYAEIEEETAGRERFHLMRQLRSIDYWQDLFPGQFVSYKRHCRRGIPGDAALHESRQHARPLSGVLVRLLHFPSPAATVTVGSRCATEVR